MAKKLLLDCGLMLCQFHCLVNLQLLCCWCFLIALTTLIFLKVGWKNVKELHGVAWSCTLQIGKCWNENHETKIMLWKTCLTKLLNANVRYSLLLHDLSWVPVDCISCCALPPGMQSHSRTCQKKPSNPPGSVWSPGHWVQECTPESPGSGCHCWTASAHWPLAQILENLVVANFHPWPSNRLFGRWPQHNSLPRVSCGKP